jgi:hypothetical protein
VESKLLHRIIKKTDNWKETDKMEECNVVWLANPVEILVDSELYALRKRQCWYNKYFGSREICNKRTFFGLINCAKKIFPEKFSKFVPKTWFFPEDRHRVNWKMYLNNPHDKKFAPTLISKPSKGYGGTGIKII